jgi:two-component system, NtrC family, nitrogen regulation sensor histidine kinase NtrY
VSLRQKLLLVFSLTVVLAVGAVAWIVSLRTRQAFTEADQKHTVALVSQFRHEFDGHAQDVAARIDQLAASDRLVRITYDLQRPDADLSPYVADAAALARDYQLDYLEILLPDGTIVSSAQWPARFGYKEDLGYGGNQPTFLKKEELSDGTSAIGLFALRAVRGVDPPVYVLGGRRLDHGFLANLATAVDTQVLLYPVLTTGFSPQELVSSTANVEAGARYSSIIEQAISSGQERIYLTDRREDSMDATAMPLKAPDGTVLAVLVVANSRRGLVELQQHIRAIGYGVAGVGILLAIAASLWITSRISRPIEELAAAATEVAAGNWETQVEVSSHDEVGALAESFNHMTLQLSDQRDRLVQSERVAAWRELARRLAHELKNPLFPLQLTVENLIRARELPPKEFDEIFREGTATLTAEITNLKNVIARFSDFSKMPKPQMQELNVREMLQKVSALYEPLLAQRQPPITFRRSMSDEALTISADPDLLHRALSNLVLNAMDAMPDGGTLTMDAARNGDWVELRVSDTGSGMTEEESRHLFTPYYTTKQYGTGLGLAIVQSVVSDHHGTIRVESKPGSGTTFVVELPSVAAGAATA